MIIKRNKVDLCILTWKYLKASLLNEKKSLNNDTVSYIYIYMLYINIMHIFILYADICAYLNASKKS